MVKIHMDWILVLMRLKSMTRKKDTIWKEKNVIAIRDQREIFCSRGYRL